MSKTKVLPADSADKAGTVGAAAIAARSATGHPPPTTGQLPPAEPDAAAPPAPPPARAACPAPHLQHHACRPTAYRVAYLACGSCPACLRDGRRAGDVCKSLEFDVGGLSERRREELFAALRAGRVPGHNRADGAGGTDER